MAKPTITPLYFEQLHYPVFKIISTQEHLFMKELEYYGFINNRSTNELNDMLFYLEALEDEIEKYEKDIEVLTQICYN